MEFTKDTLILLRNILKNRKIDQLSNEVKNVYSFIDDLTNEERELYYQLKGTGGDFTGGDFNKNEIQELSNYFNARIINTEYDFELSDFLTLSNTENLDNYKFSISVNIKDTTKPDTGLVIDFEIPINNLQSLQNNNIDYEKIIHSQILKRGMSFFLYQKFKNQF